MTGDGGKMETIKKCLKFLGKMLLYAIVAPPVFVILLTWKLVRSLPKILSFILILEVLFAIHEYGHYSEMKKRGVDVEEFSLGIGWKICQYRAGDTAFSLRAIPIAAYVKPSKKGEAQIKKMPFWQQFIIDSAGVRNNLLFAALLILLMQFWSNKKRMLTLAPCLKLSLRNLLEMPIKIIMLYFCCTADLFTFSRFNLCKKFVFQIKNIAPPKIFRNLVYWSLILGLLNFLPIPPLDGGRVFMFFLSPLLSDTVAAVINIIGFFLILIIMIFGYLKTEFVVYEEEDKAD